MLANLYFICKLILSVIVKNYNFMVKFIKGNKKNKNSMVKIYKKVIKI